MGNLKSFKKFTEDRINSVVITFGRFQPPHVGHEKLLNKILSIAKGNKYRIYTSQTCDKKNPLSYEEKIKFLRRMFPKLGRNIIEDKSIKSILDALVKLTEQKFDKVIVVVGEDRVEEFTTKLTKYNGVQSNHGRYYFKNGIEVISAGERDPDSDSLEGMSASKMRQAAVDGDYDLFLKGLPKGFDDGKELFNAVRLGLGLTEQSFRKHISLESVSDKREEFVKGSLFECGQKVRIIETNEIGVITKLGPNFVEVVLDSTGNKSRKWINSIERLLNKD